MNRLRRYELDGAADQTFGTLSGGQQARLQILLLELRGANLLLLDEPTDNLDLASAEALEDRRSAAFDGTVVAVTHDRWFMRSFDRFLVFDAGRHRPRVARAGVRRRLSRPARLAAWIPRSSTSSPRSTAAT